MIVVRLSGGLGNQLFQYAAGRALSARVDSDLVLDLSWFGERHWQTTRRSYELSHYPIRARVLGPGELERRILYTHPLLKRLPWPVGWRPLRLVRQSHSGFDSSFGDLPDDVFLDGYWQSSRFFGSVSADVRREATTDVPVTAEDAEVNAAIATSESVCIHVRRGDYVTLRGAARTHGALSPAYYQRAIARVIEAVPSPHFFVFSDDPEWTRENIRVDAPVRYVTHNTPAAAHRDLRLMSACRHQIVANSSLSWWSAWLNSNPAKIVIAPEPWFRRDDLTDLVPDQWVRVLNDTCDLRRRGAAK